MVLQQIVNTLCIAGTYALIAIGFTLFFGVINVINFAHSEIYMLGGFFGLWVYSLLDQLSLGQPFLPLCGALFMAALVPGVVGAGVERLAFRPVRQFPPLVVIVTSIAVGIIIREAVQNFVPEGASPHAFGDPLGGQTVTVGTAVVTHTQLLVMAISVFLVVAVSCIVKFTRLGRQMRAVSEDAEAAQMMGININRTIALTFLLGSALGGIAGALNGMNYGVIRFDMGLVAGFKGFTCAVIGGLSNVYGAIIGALFLATLETLFAGCVPGGSAYKDVLAFLVLILVLTSRPGGLLVYSKKAVR